MDTTFINRASVGGSWSLAYAHTCTYRSANAIQINLIALSFSAFIILDILHNRILLLMFSTEKALSSSQHNLFKHCILEGNLT